MSGKVNLSIPKPCHENWHGMTVAEKGRFCNSCQKTVYDFTRFSDRQLLEKINSESNICGRFLTSQLNKDLRMPKEKSSIWIAGVSGILSFLSLGNQEIYAQENVKTEQTGEKNTTEKRIINDSSSVPEIEITGIVTDNQDKLPIYGVFVSINGTDVKNIQTDSDGKFSIKAKKGDSLDFSFLGYETKTILVTSQKNIAITLIENKRLYTLGIVATFEKRRTFFGRIFHSIGNLFR
ncbi:carboxypeptidase-like regulatory domain-containing protein [Flavobacterium microcysteis]